MANFNPPLTCQLTTRYRLSALHLLARPELSPEQNAQHFVHCGKLHGHEYGLEVTWEAEIDPRSGLCVQREKLNDLVEEKILKVFHKQKLNDIVSNTSGEFLAREFLTRLIREERGHSVVQVALQETHKNRFLCRKEDLEK